MSTLCWLMDLEAWSDRIIGSVAGETASCALPKKNTNRQKIPIAVNATSCFFFILEADPRG